MTVPEVNRLLVGWWRLATGEREHRVPLPKVEDSPRLRKLLERALNPTAREMVAMRMAAGGPHG